MNITKNTKPEYKQRRPHFSPRQLLTSEQLNQEQAFHLESLQRAVHGLAGSGVVYGYTLSTDDNGSLVIKDGCIEISCGLAFDNHGRQLYWHGGWVSIDDLAGDKPDFEGEYSLCVHYAEYREGKSSSDCDPCESNKEEVFRIDHCVVFTLKKGCKDISSDCETWERCPDIGAYACHYNDQQTCFEEADKLCPGRCRCEYYDPENCIVIGCIKICNLTGEVKDCEPDYGFCECEPIICDHRQQVYRNDLLRQLIQGHHLNYTTVEGLSWQDWILYEKRWSEPIGWDDFVSRIKSKGGFEISFSKPVQISTLNPGSIILSAVTQEVRTDYWESRRIPLSIKHLGEENDCATSVRLKFEDDWCKSEIKDQRSTLEYGVIIELKIRGSMIRDKCGCMLDARPLKLNDWEYKCCQSMPGGDFLALFRVAPKSRDNNKEEYESSAEYTE